MWLTVQATTQLTKQRLVHPLPLQLPASDALILRQVDRVLQNALALIPCAVAALQRPALLSASQPLGQQRVA